MASDSIESLLDSVINESLESVKLNEKDKQVTLASKNDVKQGHDSEQDTANDEKIINDTPTVDDIVEKLNSIRSGKSLRDSLIKQRFEGYVNDLDDVEKVALFAFLKGINQIVTGDIEPNQAFEPEDDPAKVHMHKLEKERQAKAAKAAKKNVQKVNKKPRVLKPGSSNSDGEEDTTPPVPIKVKT